MNREAAYFKGIVDMLPSELLSASWSGGQHRARYADRIDLDRGFADADRGVVTRVLDPGGVAGSRRDSLVSVKRRESAFSRASSQLHRKI